MNKFADWMLNNDKKQCLVAPKIGISTSGLHEILRLGKIPTIKIAYEIEKYTHGAITIYDWLDYNIETSHTVKIKKNPDKKRNKK